MVSRVYVTNTHTSNLGTNNYQYISKFFNDDDYYDDLYCFFFTDTWWAIALFRGQSALVKLKRSRRELLTVAMLLAGVHSRYQSESHGVDRLEDLRSFMVEGGYVREMIVHHRPRGFVQAEQNDFEMLAKGPVVVAFDVFQATKTNSGRTGTWDK